MTRDRSGSGAAGPTPVRVAAAVVWDREKILLTQRPPGGNFGEQWEFPGGKLEPGESPETAVVREVREELGVEARVTRRLHVERHDYPDGPSVEITFLGCELDSHVFVPGRGVHAFQWVAPADVALSGLLAADRDFVRSLGAHRP